MARQLSGQILRLYPCDSGLAPEKCQTIILHNEPDDCGDKWHPVLRVAFAAGSTATLWALIAGSAVWLIG